MAEICEQELQERLKKDEKEIFDYKQRYQHGLKVVYKGQDESDEICCPICGIGVARNDDFIEFRPKHCSECGTRLLY